MHLTNLNFSSILIFLVITIIVIYLFFRAYKNQQKISQTFKKLATSKYFYLKYVFLILAFFTIFLSIFWIKMWQSIPWNEEKWIDIVFVLDVSKSMNVADISSNDYSYTRLLFAKNAIAEFVANNSNNKYSLVIFAWDAISSVPLTSDKNIFLSVLNNVDYKNLTIQGSDFVKAFELANNRALISEDKSKAIIFISDWWDGDYNIDEKVLQSMRNEDIEYFMAWVGTKEWWRIITWRDVFWSISYQIYNWEYVISKLNENNLKKLAWIFDWKYLKLDKYNDINNFSSEIEKIEKKVIENNTYSNDVDASRMLAFISFLFFILYLILYLNSWKLTVNGKWFIW